MKKILAVAAFMLLAIFVLTLYVSAQGGGIHITGHGVMPASVSPVREIVLLQGLSQEERLPEGVQIISQPANGTIVRNGTIKIAMSDGSVQEIPIVKVKKLTIETQ